MDHHPWQLYRGPIGKLAQPFVDRLRGRGLATRYNLLWKAHRALWHLTGSDRVQIYGFDLRVDPHDSLSLARGWYEPDETRWYRANVRPGDFVVEAGANIGVFTLLLSQLVGPDGRVRSYEPDPQLRAILERNITENGGDNIAVRPVAVAEQPGEMTFFRASRNQGDNRLFSHNGKDGARFPVTVVALDDELADQPRVDLLKLDIQGAEPQALRGLRSTLADRPPRRMLMEFWPHGIAGMGDDPRTMIEELQGYGYTITTLESGAPFDVEAALQVMTPENRGWANLVLEHADA